MRVLETDQAAPFKPTALTRGRMLRGLSQGDLAIAAHLSRQQVLKLEHGQVQNPTAGTVHALAAALRVPAYYLGTEPGAVPPKENLHFRGKARRPVRVVEELQVRGEHFRRVVRHLEGYVRVPAVHIPDRPAAGVAAIEEAAEVCRVEWGLRTDNPLANVTRLLERAGVFVGLFRLEDDAVEAFSWWDERPIVLCKRNSDSATRRRFSLAHELGHLVLHRRVVSGERTTEDEANRFASAILMPAAAFRREFPRAGTRMDWTGLLEMKQRWGTSVQAILRRALDLGMITDAAYHSAYIRISQLGWRRQEPNEPDHEQPELVRSVVDSLRTRSVTEHGIAEAIGFDVGLLEDAAGVGLRERPATLIDFANVIDMLQRRAAGR